MERSSVSPGRSITVIDLDGTLLRGNSLIHLTCYAWKRVGWKQRSEMAWWIMLRRLKIASHWEMKQHILQAVSSLNMTPFAFELAKRIRPQVLDLAKNSDILLATAASATYAYPLAEILEIPFCQATDSDHENRGEHKLNNVLTLGLPVQAVITDHLDDLPLLEHLEGKKYLVNPNRKTLKAVREKHIHCQVINCY